MRPSISRRRKRSSAAKRVGRGRAVGAERRSVDIAGRSGSGTGADVEVEDCRAVRKVMAEVVAGEVENGGPILATSLGRGGMEV